MLNVNPNHINELEKTRIHLQTRNHPRGPYTTATCTPFLTGCPSHVNGTLLEEITCYKCILMIYRIQYLLMNNNRKDILDPVEENGEWKNFSEDSKFWDWFAERR